MSDERERNIVHRELETDGEQPALQIAMIVVDIEGKDVNELATTYGCIDHVLDHIFSDPPSPEAQAEISFSYEGYRITVEQNGRAEFVKVG